MHCQFVEGKNKHWELWIDHQKWREVHTSIFGKKPVLPTVSSEATLEAIFNEYEYRRVRAYVIWRLSKQSYHSEQLGKLLKARLVQNQNITKVLSECKECGFLDDELWVKNYVKQKQKNQSWRFIHNSLRSKGLSSQTLQQISNEWGSQSQIEIVTIKNIIDKRYRSLDMSDYKNRHKVIQSLLRKGFTYEQIQEVFHSQVYRL